jgi:protoheme IX farnesyltransferase
MQDSSYHSTSLSLAEKVRDYIQLSKFTLSFTVVFSCVVCYLLASNVIIANLGTLWMIIILFTAGMLVTASANAVNQIVEKDTDALMKRTSKRPIASGRMSPQQGYIFATITGIIGIFLIGYFFNVKSAALSLFSLFLYGYIYTPLKKVNSVAVLVGALPGALPCLIGWVAATNDWSAGGWVLFGIQFLWQFPHFWAIAWVAHNDYTKAGFKLLPSAEGPNKFTALQALTYAVLMIPVGLLPYVYHISGYISMWIVLAANGFIVIQCIRLYVQLDVKAARRVMFSSYIYLPVVLLALLADKS